LKACFRNFCEKIQFTHVATVQDGTFKLEQRDTRSSDWIIEGLSSAASSETTTAATNGAVSPAKEIDPKLRKQAFNAPKRIVKLEALIEEAEANIAKLDAEMIEIGNDVGRLVDMTKEKNNLESKIGRYMEEWGELEEILARVAA